MAEDVLALARGICLRREKHRGTNAKTGLTLKAKFSSLHRLIVAFQQRELVFLLAARRGILQLVCLPCNRATRGKIEAATVGGGVGGGSLFDDECLQVMHELP